MALSAPSIEAAPFIWLKRASVSARRVARGGSKVVNSRSRARIAPGNQVGSMALMLAATCGTRTILPRRTLSRRRNVLLARVVPNQELDLLVGQVHPGDL